MSNEVMADALLLSDQTSLPESAFSQFAAANAVEVHLATAFQSAILDAPTFPKDLLDRIL